MNKLAWIMVILVFTFLVSAPLEGMEKTQFSQEELFKLSENFFNYLREGKYEVAEALFSPEVQETLSEEALKKTWESLTSDLGPLQETKDYQATAERGYQMVYARCEFEKAEFKAKLVLSGMVTLGTPPKYSYALTWASIQLAIWVSS